MASKTPSSPGEGDGTDDSLAASRSEPIRGQQSSPSREPENENALGSGAQAGIPTDHGFLPRPPAAQMPNQSEHLDALLSRRMNPSFRAAQLASLGGSPSYLNTLANPAAATLGNSEDELLTRLLLSRLQASNRNQLLNELLRTTPIADLDDETLYRLRARQGALTSFRSQLNTGSGLFGPTNPGALGPFPLGSASALSREQLRYHAEHGLSRNMMNSFTTTTQRLGQPTGAMGNLKRDRDDGDEELQSKAAKKKKAPAKKKPADMPRRPLSAYNLFFSDERQRILKEMSAEGDEKTDGGETGSDGEKKMDAASKSEEDRHEKSPSSDVTDEVECSALKRPLVRDSSKRRPHRKTHGKIGFKSLAQMVGQRWRSLPPEKLSYYQKLAEEDSKRQKLAMEEYYKKKNDAKAPLPTEEGEKGK